LKSISGVDYSSLGQAAFGPVGGRLVALCLASELLLALVSFFINIGINLSAISIHFHPIQGIILASVLSIVLSSLNIKYVSYSSALGVLMTFLIVFALSYSAMQLQDDPASQVTKENVSFNESGNYQHMLRLLYDEMM